MVFSLKFHKSNYRFFFHNTENNGLRIPYFEILKLLLY